MFKGYAVPGVVTGKPIEIGGSVGRTEATGRGIGIVALEAMNQYELADKNPRIAVQGMGNVGSNLAQFLYDEGYRIVAVSDVSGGIYKEDGLNITKVREYLEVSENHTLEGYYEEDVHTITNTELLTCDCEVLIPCALENQITVENAADIQAKLIIEGANGPTTAEADEILNEKGIPVIPDILANAGGVVVSYFEWVQNLQSFVWDLDNVNSTLKKIMTNSYHEVKAIVEQEKVSFRIAAYMLALKRLSAATRIRGIYP